MSQNLKDLSVAELQIKDRELRESLFKLRFQHGIRRLDNPAQLSRIKKDIARVQTFLAQKANQQ
ncbi:50S ribosomal protein L29 [Desulfobulbus oralis]|uniref:Large ribosomal subunit protein uL29 n=1 Tax=Desulfobulbus oralis TaxID=1986146 RepID=A0A2L1GQC5_9BACT|nr:50S ribosomal protein L29 [Desulfobulbus oralis]AVD71885.1 50S ribosomal protein L29 [Desulfobulbus oralis]